MAQNITIKDIADECGLAISSVSKALNPSSKKNAVSDATRQKVFETAKRFGYQPNWQAQALARKKTHNISFVFKTDMPMTMGIYEDFFKTLITRFKKNDYHVIYTQFTDVEDFAGFISSNKADAYILLTYYRKNHYSIYLIPGNQLFWLMRKAS